MSGCSKAADKADLRYCCRACSQILCSLGGYRKHFKNNHPEANQGFYQYDVIKPDSGTASWYKCRCCPKIFVGKKKYTAHITTVHFREPSESDIINKPNSTDEKKTSPEKRKPTSTTPEPVRGSNLKIYTCKHCGREYNNYYSCYSHVKKNHPEGQGNLAITSTNQKTASSTNQNSTSLVPVQGNENDGKIYECKPCKKQYGNYKSYSSHFRTLHPGVIARKSDYTYIKKNKKDALKVRDPGVCIFCDDGVDDEMKCGKLLQSPGLTVHYFCMLFASGLSQNGKTDTSGLLGFLPVDINKEVRRGKRLRCIYCKKLGATIGCIYKSCRQMFHLPCGRKNATLHQFYGNFRSFCEDHRPEQELSIEEISSTPVKQKIMTCPICMHEMKTEISTTTMKAPCCKNSWFHRECIQQTSLASGTHFFKCPLCNNKDEFQSTMLEFGIYIPDRDAAWELEPNAYQDLLERHCRCDLKKCVCPKGRSYDKPCSKWEIILCDNCGSRGTHLECAGFKHNKVDWICKNCEAIQKKDVRRVSHNKFVKLSQLKVEGVSEDKQKELQRKWTEHLAEHKASSGYPGPGDLMRKRKHEDDDDLPTSKRYKEATPGGKSRLSLSKHTKNATHTQKSKKYTYLNSKRPTKMLSKQTLGYSPWKSPRKRALPIVDLGRNNLFKEHGITGPVCTVTSLETGDLFCSNIVKKPPRLNLNWRNGSADSKRNTGTHISPPTLPIMARNSSGKQGSKFWTYITEPNPTEEPTVKATRVLPKELKQIAPTADFLDRDFYKTVSEGLQTKLPSAVRKLLEPPKGWSKNDSYYAQMNFTDLQALAVSESSPTKNSKVQSERKAIALPESSSSNNSKAEPEAEAITVPESSPSENSKNQPDKQESKPSKILAELLPPKGWNQEDSFYSNLSKLKSRRIEPSMEAAGEGGGKIEKFDLYSSSSEELNEAVLKGLEDLDVMINEMSPESPKKITQNAEDTPRSTQSLVKDTPKSTQPFIDSNPKLKQACIDSTPKSTQPHLDHPPKSPKSGKPINKAIEDPQQMKPMTTKLYQGFVKSLLPSDGFKDKTTLQCDTDSPMKLRTGKTPSTNSTPIKTPSTNSTPIKMNSNNVIKKLQSTIHDTVDDDIPKVAKEGNITNGLDQINNDAPLKDNSIVISKLKNMERQLSKLTSSEGWTSKLAADVMSDSISSNIEQPSLTSADDVISDVLEASTTPIKDRCTMALTPNSANMAHSSSSSASKTYFLRKQSSDTSATSTCSLEGSISGLSSTSSKNYPFKKQLSATPNGDPLDAIEEGPLSSDLSNNSYHPLLQNYINDHMVDQPLVSPSDKNNNSPLKDCPSPSDNIDFVPSSAGSMDSSKNMFPYLGQLDDDSNTNIKTPSNRIEMVPSSTGSNEGSKPEMFAYLEQLKTDHRISSRKSLLHDFTQLYPTPGLDTQEKPPSAQKRKYVKRKKCRCQKCGKFSLNKAEYLSKLRNTCKKGNDTSRLDNGASAHYNGASIQYNGISTQCNGASIQYNGVSTQDNGAEHDKVQHPNFPTPRLSNAQTHLESGEWPSIADLGACYNDGLEMSNSERNKDIGPSKSSRSRSLLREPWGTKKKWEQDETPQSSTLSKAMLLPETPKHYVKIHTTLRISHT